MPPPTATTITASQAATTIHVAPTILTQPKTSQHSFVVRALWFLLVGWWLSAIVIILGYLLVLLIITMPFGLHLLNQVPQALTLRQRTVHIRVSNEGGATVIGYGTETQRPWWQRAIYLLLIGWWFGAIWAVAGWVFSVILLTLPLGVWMLNRLGSAITLHRH